MQSNMKKCNNKFNLFIVFDVYKSICDEETEFSYHYNLITFNFIIHDVSLDMFAKIGFNEITDYQASSTFSLRLLFLTEMSFDNTFDNYFYISMQDQKYINFKYADCLDRDYIYKYILGDHYIILDNMDYSLKELLSNQNNEYNSGRFVFKIEDIFNDKEILHQAMTDIKSYSMN